MTNVTKMEAFLKEMILMCKELIVAEDEVDTHRIVHSMQIFYMGHINDVLNQFRPQEDSFKTGDGVPGNETIQ